MHTPLEKYFDLRTKNMFNHLHDFELNGDEQSMHDLRVEIKKMRAIIKFLQSIYSRPHLKEPAHLIRHIFQRAGRIREEQLLQIWLRKNNLVSIESNCYPPEKLEFLVEEFRRHSIQYKDDFKEIIAVLDGLVRNTNVILAEHYFVDINSRVEKLIRRNLPQTEWHELRKLIKQRLFSYNWVEHGEGDDDPNFSFFQKLQEAIGLWHDLDIIKQSFSRKQIWLSQDLEVQKEFAVAWEKLTAGIKQREKQIEELISRQLVSD